MWGSWQCEPPAWPVAPRPFAVEPIGGWLGRVAARYRMSVGELAQRYDLELPFDRSAETWLQLSTMGEATLAKLAVLARLNTADLAALQRPHEGAEFRRQLAYCPTCVFLNPIDVTAPCWRREWLDPAATCCRVHAWPLQGISTPCVQACGNFDGLLKAISRLEATRRRRRW